MDESLSISFRLSRPGGSGPDAFRADCARVPLHRFGGASLMRPIDLSLYYITDASLSAERGLVATTLGAVAGGATIVQLRDPAAKGRALVEQARALVAALRPLGVPLIVNDRADIALAAGADGVHVGQDDLPPQAVRAIMGADAIVGLSITDVGQMADVPWDAVDHIGVGPVISKGVKLDASEPMGFAGLAACVRVSRKPVVAIGGMTAETVPYVVASGADGVAVVAAIAGAPDSEAAARRIRHALDVAFGVAA
jgi:thiamine-phosphate pyrophosphorylase